MNSITKRIFIAMVAVALTAGCGTNGTTTTPNTDVPAGINENGLADQAGKTDSTSNGWLTIEGPIGCQQTVTGKTTGWARFDGYTFKANAGSEQTFKTQTSKFGRLLVYGPRGKNGKWGGLKFAAWVPFSKVHQTYTTVVKWTPSADGEYLVAIGSYVGGIEYDLNLGCLVAAPHCVEYVTTDENGNSLRNFYAVNVQSYEEGKKHLAQLHGQFIDEAINPGKCHEQSTACPLYFVYQPVCGDVATTQEGQKTYDSDCAFKVAVRQASATSDWDGSKGHWELGACKPTCDPANDPYRQYDAKTCQVVRFVCPEGTEYFSDECGCGCKPSLRWVVSCGTPVCYENQPAPTDVPTCKPDQQTGSPCSVDGQRCIPEKPLDCGRTLICLTSQPVVCPISQRKFKTGIRYLSESDKSKLYTDLKSIDLATLNATKGRDLYGYTSVTVAALQTQAKQLETLRRQIEALQKRVKALTHSTISK